ncbi:MAG: twin-arginine translocase TatA/TatE family subunit [Planctomycetes bacterium]|nr:twin-arginine translocase TatA/TatE family subunit [Planctomycetota bacterium]
MVSLLFLGNIGPLGLVAIAIIALLMFGNRLPNVMRNLGKGMNSFKQGLKESADDEDDDDSKPAKAKKD